MGTEKIRLMKELNEMEFLEANMRGLTENSVGFLQETNLAACGDAPVILELVATKWILRSTSYLDHQSSMCKSQ